MLSDLVGVPDLFARIKPTLLSLLPWRKADSSVGELKWWARALITIWVCTVIPLLLLNLGLLVIYAPRLFATTWDSLRLLATDISASFAGGELMSLLADSVKAGLLMLFMGGIVVMFLRLGKRFVSAGLTRTQGRPVGRTLFAGATLALFGLVSVVWWRSVPRVPVQPGEEMTVSEVARAALGGEGLPKRILPVWGDEADPGAVKDLVGAPAEGSWARLIVPDNPPFEFAAPVPIGSLDSSPTSEPSPSKSEDSSSEPAASPEASPSPEPSPSPEASPSSEASPSPVPSP